VVNLLIAVFIGFAFGILAGIAICGFGRMGESKSDPVRKMSGVNPPKPANWSSPAPVIPPTPRTRIEIEVRRG
jgi:hypothetical protein